MRLALVATHHADYAANLALALSEHHEVMLLLSQRNAARQLHADAFAWLRSRLRLHIVPHHLAPLQPYIAWACHRLIGRFAPDLVHVQEHPTRSMAILAGRLGARLPLVTTVHDPQPHSGRDTAAAALLADACRRLRTASDGLIVHGRAMIAPLAEGGFARERITAINHGVLRYGRFGPGAAPVATEIDPRRLIFFGRMERYKGLDTLLAANRLWLERGVPIRLTVAGDGPEIAAQALRAPNIDLHQGRVPQDVLGAMVAGSAAVVLPYHDGTQSGVVASAFGANRPVICSDVGGLAEAVGPAGLLVPPRDPDALAIVGARLVTEADLVPALEIAVRQQAAGPLSWAEIAERTGEVYRRSIARRAAISCVAH